MLVFFIHGGYCFDNEVTNLRLSTLKARRYYLAIPPRPLIDESYKSTQNVYITGTWMLFSLANIYNIQIYY